MTIVALGAFLVALAFQRVWELRISARNTLALRERGAREYGSRHFPLFVLLHVFFPIAVTAEVLWGGSEPPRTWPVWLGIWLGAQLLRYGAIRTLGESWNVRIWVVPGRKPVRHGLYRYLRHPNYLAVVLELLAAPLMFGAWRTALIVSALNFGALAIRIRTEERALAEAAAQGTESP